MTVLQTNHRITSRQQRPPVADDPVVLVGHPNVGKSVLFGAMTNRYVTVSNYPGTTVEVALGTLACSDRTRTVIDTPGVHGLTPMSEDERITRQVLIDHGRATVVVVADMKNLRRGLMIALEAADAQLPMVLALNMADEAEQRGVKVDVARLSALLGIPVVPMIAIKGVGLPALVKELASARPVASRTVFEPVIEDAAAKVADRLPGTSFNRRALALMYLAGDDGLLDDLKAPAECKQACAAIRAQATAKVGKPLSVVISSHRLYVAAAILQQTMHVPLARRDWRQTLGRLACHPVWGWPILAAVLYGIYQVVGVFGAGTLVDMLEEGLFGQIINPWAVRIVGAVAPAAWVEELFVGEFGLITMGLTYGLAIVLPIVSMFFLAFSVLEDSGYLPRLAVMLDRLFRAMNLNGKAVLPMILGLGCDTMATVTTRILETRKERLIVTILLALGVPCSAQLGVLLGMMSGIGAAAVTIWAAVVFGVVLVVGFCASRIIPGESSAFILELPPIRVPALRNILAKTAARVEWYVKEVVPVFLIGTAVLFVLHETQALGLIERAMAPAIVGWLGLPEQTAGVFLVGFLRRDYGAAGLFAIARDGGLTANQILVSLVVVTLFMPCIAHLLIMVKEHGARMAVTVAGFVFATAFVVGGLLHWTLRLLNVTLG